MTDTTVTRKTLKTIGIWNLVRLDYSDGEHYYHIKVDGNRGQMGLYVYERPHIETGRMMFAVEYTHSSNNMNLEEAAEFFERAKQLLEIAAVFQQEIDSCEGVLDPKI